jgi:hypothetical protein
MDGFVEHLVGLVVWLVSIVVYVDARRRGRRGFTRLVAFWLGFPATWISLFVVREGSQPDILPPPDDEAALLEEIRRARDAGRSLEDGTQAPPDGGDPATPEPREDA